MRLDLTGKTAIVTGATSGIGLAIAEALGASGADVVIVGRDEARLTSTLERVRATGARCEAVLADLTDDQAPAEIVDRAVTRFGRLTTLVNCAGRFELAPFEESLPLLDRQWLVNVRSAFELTRVAISHLRPGGSVIFLSSISALIGVATAAAYSVTKGAIESLTRSLAIEEAPHNVRVNSIVPGNIHTPMNAKFFEDPTYEKTVLDLTPMRRIGEVEDIAPAVVYLASDASSYMSGNNLVIDGGFTAR